jgi:hypothetical protein
LRPETAISAIGYFLLAVGCVVLAVVAASAPYAGAPADFCRALGCCGLGALALRVGRNVEDGRRW